MVLCNIYSEEPHYLLCPLPINEVDLGSRLTCVTLQLITRGAFLSGDLHVDPREDWGSKITPIMVHQRNQWIHSGHRLIGSKWSWITDYPKQAKECTLTSSLAFWLVPWILVGQSVISNAQAMKQLLAHEEDRGRIGKNWERKVLSKIYAVNFNQPRNMWTFDPKYPIQNYTTYNFQQQELNENNNGRKVAEKFKGTQFNII